MSGSACSLGGNVCPSIPHPKIKGGVSGGSPDAIVGGGADIIPVYSQLIASTVDYIRNCRRGGRITNCPIYTAPLFLRFRISLRLVYHRMSIAFRLPIPHPRKVIRTHPPKAMGVR